MTPKAVEPRWLDNYQYPGQKVELTTPDGTAVPVAICSSPSEARNKSGVGNFSMINVLVDKDSSSADLVSAEPEAVYDISRIHGPGFSNPVNDDINLTSILEVTSCPKPLRACKLAAIARRSSNAVVACRRSGRCLS
jgi:hypothetical protein